MIMTETITYSFKEIWLALYNKMLEIKNTNLRVGEVFNHDVKIEWWISLPAIIVTPTNGTSGYLDTCCYQSKINYNVYLIDRLYDWYADVEDNMREIADIMMSKLKEISTIRWTNDDWYTVSCEFDFQWWFTDTQEPMRIFTVNCRFTAISK